MPGSLGTLKRLIMALSVLLLPGLGLWPAAAPAQVMVQGSAERSATARALHEYRLALEAGEEKPYPALSLPDHAALPWLKMEWMRARLDELEAEEVARFISRHRNRPFASELRRDWLLSLGRAERWRDFNRHYRGERDQSLQCLAQRARLHRDPRSEALHREIRALWLTGRSLPGECQPLFDFAREEGHISDFMVRERFGMALRRNNLALAARLAEDIDDAARERVATRQAIYRDPAGLMDELEAEGLETADSDLYVSALKRLARRDPRASIDRWEAAREAGLEASDDEVFRLTRRIALEAARAHLPEAAEWLAESRANDRFIRAWRIRNALRLGEWEQALTAIDSAPGDDSRQWRYWRARALEQLERTEEADRLYRALARQADYYGLLAARRMDAPPERPDRPIEAAEDRQQALEEKEALRMAAALLEMGWESAARQEWRHGLQSLDRDDRCQAARLAYDWGWAGEAVVTAARAGCRGDPEVDYPLAFAELMKPRVERFALDPAWAWSIMRAESLFATEARSRVGALGLMQLMPATAEDMASRLDLELNGERDILEPAHNIELGTGYLRAMLDRFNEHPLVATAAYNAGPHRAEAWLPEDGALDGDVWAEVVPFQETRRYIRRVMTHSLGFDRRLDRNGDTLGLRLAPVGRHGGALCQLAEAHPDQDGDGKTDEDLALSC